MSMDDTLNFFRAMAQRLQHGGLLADQANELGILMTPHLDALEKAQKEGTQIIDVTPNRSREVVPANAFRPPSPPSEWSKQSDPQQEAFQRWQAEQRRQNQEQQGYRPPQPNEGGAQYNAPTQGQNQEPGPWTPGEGVR